MKIKVNYWPNTPNLRQVNIFYHDDLIVSCFCSKEQIKGMIDDLRDAYLELNAESFTNE